MDLAASRRGKKETPSLQENMESFEKENVGKVQHILVGGGAGEYAPTFDIKRPTEKWIL